MNSVFGEKLLVTRQTERLQSCRPTMQRNHALPSLQQIA